jgi:glucosamine--fructose-6-phosphate aminotransferase (isomerizing)
MKHTAMWQEIQDQPGVASKILETYLPKGEYFRELLLKKKQLILTGIGASLYACHMARYVFMKYCNLKPQIIQSDELSYILPSIDQDTLVIFISQSGESYETKVVGRELNERGIPFWGITNEPASSLARNASEVMLLHSGREISSATKTNMASFLILAIIAAGYRKELTDTFLEIPGRIQRTLGLCAGNLEGLADSLLEGLNLYILGMGANAATAIEGALMMKEKTFIHTGGSSVSDFRHGTVEVIEPGLPVILLASGKEYTKKALIHGEYLRNAGVKVTLITDTPGTAADSMEGEHIIPVLPCGEEVLSPILFLMPLQLLAERVADKKGLDVDGFRHLSKVVGDYTGREQRNICPAP